MSTPRKWPSTDQSLIWKLRDRSDEKSWETFVNIYKDVIFRYATKWGRLQSQDAQDVVSEVLRAVARSIETYDRERKFRSWLKVITQNSIKRLWSKNKPIDGSIELGDVAGRDSIWDEELFARVLTCALERIRGEFDDLVWYAFERRWLEEAPVEIVAHECKQKPSWVYKAVHRVTQRLKEEIAFLADDELWF